MSAAAKSEGVEKEIDFVKVKKAEGTLYLMNERIAWMPRGKDSFTISHHYADIKTQKISPEGKPKVQLQIVLHDNTSDTFHFAHPDPSKQLEDRNKAKDILTEKLPKYQRKTPKELEDKQKILLTDPKAKSNYDTLVLNRIVTAEKFWENRSLVESAFSEAPRGQRINGLKEEVGVSNNCLTDIKIDKNGTNGPDFTIKRDFSEAIFRIHPPVKRKHAEWVGTNRITEKEFWHHFLQSPYYLRDRTSSTKDFFADCARQDEVSIQEALKKGITDPFFDLRALDDEVVPTLDNVVANPDKNNAKQELSTNKILIRNLNNHSIMILDSCRMQKRRRDPLLAGINKTKKEDSDPKEDDAGELDKLEELRIKTKKRRLMESTEYDDLEGKLPSVGVNFEDFIEQGEVNSLTVSQGFEERYMHGPTPLLVMNHALHAHGHGTVSMLQRLKSCLQQWQPLAATIIDSHKAIQTVTDLSPGGVLWKKEAAMGATNLREELPKDVMAKLKKLCLALDELLVKFWNLKPAANDSHEKKCIESHEELQRFECTLLQPFHDEVSKELHQDLTSHLFNKLRAAYQRFSTWKAKRPLHKSGNNVR